MNDTKIISKKEALRLMSDIERAVAPESSLSVANFVRAIQDGLTATRQFKDKSGNIVEVPDDRAREGAMNRWEKMIDRGLAYGVGLPIQRSEQVTKNVEISSDQQIKERMKSKAYRRMLQAEIDRAEAEASEVKRQN